MSNRKSKSAAFLLTALLAWPYLATAQKQETAGNNAKLKIDEIKIEYVELKADDIDIEAESLPGGKDTKWLRIQAIYRVAPSRTRNAAATRYSRHSTDWIDDCTFSWRVVVTQPGTEGIIVATAVQNAASFSRDITYDNIEADARKKHRAFIYVPPQFLARYTSSQTGDNGVFVELTVKLGGKVRTKAWARGNAFHTGSKIPPGMFPPIKGGSWFVPGLVQEVESGLLSRLESPWIWSNFDLYESIKSVN